MLVMRRRAGESFLIGADVEIQILEIGHNRVRIGVTAPATVPIVRKEVVLTTEENLTAARNASREGIEWISEQLRIASGALSPSQRFDAVRNENYIKK
jgi:carbon storage regulator